MTRPDTDTLNERNYLLYDGDCPLCANYVQLMQLRKSIGPVELLNAREHPTLAAHYRAQGYDLNEGMLLRWDQQIYWGADCINRIALLSTSHDWLNQAHAAIFRHACLSKALYPFMQAGRRLSLTLLGKSKI